MKSKALICAAIALVIALSPLDIKSLYWQALDDTAQTEASTEVKAWCADMTVDEYKFLSAVVEAESDRSSNKEGRVLIALTVLNRVESSQFPNSIDGVLTQSGQFQVVTEGTYKKVGRTDLSDKAVVEAAIRSKGEHPNVIYFNCIGYNYLGSPYCYEGGNYFETL